MIVKIVLEKDASLRYGPIYLLSEEENKVLKRINRRKFK